MRTRLGAATRESARYSHLREGLPDCDFFRSLLGKEWKHPEENNFRELCLTSASNGSIS
jgi:hypothetical protein